MKLFRLLEGRGLQQRESHMDCTAQKVDALERGGRLKSSQSVGSIGLPSAKDASSTDEFYILTRKIRCCTSCNWLYYA